jgi:glutamate-ammonia-ligase adenylyltransferase
MSSLEEKHPRDAAKLRKNDGLLSDTLTLAAFSPLLATTLLQNPEYIWWISRKRHSPAVRTKDELLEALGRFVLTHSQLDLHTQLARFRRRELLRIFLGDIRRLATIAEITEDISNLADAILETALRRARQEMDNRFGQPQAIDDKGRKTTAEFCIVSLGKLGSRELNYSSDIDLLFIYSTEGETTGTGSRGVVTNREYFVKLGETVAQLVGKHSGEGAAYRVDMRLRPHGRVGPLAISLDDAVRYYTNEARDWERQVLIRSRASAGDAEIYRRFFDRVEESVFVAGAAVESDDGSQVRKALANVKTSKQLIDAELRTDRGFNVKLGRGGIREIEFIAQALQLAYGGDDRWLRASHTLISLARLADRSLITEAELTELFNAYEFLRHLEHVLQMENGLQTHTVPEEPERRVIIAKRMRCQGPRAFTYELQKHTENVHRVFVRVFSSDIGDDDLASPDSLELSQHLPPVAGHGGSVVSDDKDDSGLQTREQFLEHLMAAITAESDFRHKLGAFRRRWSQLLSSVQTAEMRDEIEMPSAKRIQTALAEASIEAALQITRNELEERFGVRLDALPVAVMGLGKLGGGAIDYESDLDLVLVHNEDDSILPPGQTAAEFYGRAAEIFVTTLSSMTRDGSIYRVDLRLRPYGKNGRSMISAKALANYMLESAAIWEWLAYVKTRAVGGDLSLAENVENELREIIHRRAASVDPIELRDETRRVRMRLEKEKTKRRRSKDVDIKYGPGGLLDVYFAMRFLQLRDNIPDSRVDRSTANMLRVLRDSGSLNEGDFEVMSQAYRFLSTLDHNLRLLVGRTTRLPDANPKALTDVALRMDLSSAEDLVEQLTIHRINLRSAFDNILGPAV